MKFVKVESCRLRLSSGFSSTSTQTPMHSSVVGWTILRSAGFMVWLHVSLFGTMLASAHNINSRSFGTKWLFLEKSNIESSTVQCQAGSQKKSVQECTKVTGAEVCMPVLVDGENGEKVKVDRYFEIFFRMPVLCDYVLGRTKNEISNSVTTESPEDKMKDFISQSASVCIWEDHLSSGLIFEWFAQMFRLITAGANWSTPKHSSVFFVTSCGSKNLKERGIQCSGKNKFYQVPGRLRADEAYTGALEAFPAGVVHPKMDAARRCPLQGIFNEISTDTIRYYWTFQRSSSFFQKKVPVEKRSYGNWALRNTLILIGGYGSLGIWNHWQTTCSCRISWQSLWSKVVMHRLGNRFA